MNAKHEVVQNKATYTDYESGAPFITWISPTFMGYEITINASAFENGVMLDVWLSASYYGFYNKRFYCKSDVSFNWVPPAMFSPSLSFNFAGPRIRSEISFSLSIELSLTLPAVGVKSKQWTNKFDIPLETQLLSDALFQPAPADLSANDISAMYQIVMHSLGNENNTDRS